MNERAFSQNAPTIYWDLLGLTAAGQLYGTPDAARDAGQEAARQKGDEDFDRAKKERREEQARWIEYCGLVCCNKDTGKYYFTGPHPGSGKVGDFSRCVPSKSPCKGEDPEVGWYHYHPGNNPPSEDDLKLTDEGNLPGSVWDGGGRREIWVPDPNFDPDPNKPWKQDENGGRGDRAYWDKSSQTWKWLRWDRKQKKYVPIPERPWVPNPARPTNARPNRPVNPR